MMGNRFAEDRMAMGFFDTEEQAMHAAIKAARLHDQYVYVIRESDGERVGEVAP